jgi:hypothetical protein
MSHSKRLSIVALVVSLLATMLVGWAGTGVALADEPARIDLKVLVITNDVAAPAVGAWEALLKREGVPYETFDLSAGQVTSSLLQSGRHAFYEAVVCATSCSDELDAIRHPGELDILNAYQITFGIRRVNAFVWPWGYGFSSPFECSLAGSTAQLTAAGQSVFGYLLGPVGLDPYANGYCAGVSPGAQHGTLLTGPGGSSLIGIYQNPAGFEEMVVTINSNKDQLHALLLGHGQLSWVTRGVYLGYNRNYFSAQFDDIFMASDRWKGGSVIRMVPSDVTRAMNWSAANKIRLDLVYNGVEAAPTPVPNRAPVAVSSSVMPGPGALSASDADSDGLTFSIVTAPTNGAVVVTNAAMGAFTYTPGAGFPGSTSFTFKANDGEVDSNVATVTVTAVPGPNSAPVAVGSSVWTELATPVSGRLSATDADSDTLTFTIVTEAATGEAVINEATGAFTYTPDAGDSGTDTFTFKANDGEVDSNVATVSVGVGDGGLTQALLSNSGAFRWVNHTWSHLDLDNTLNANPPGPYVLASLAEIVAEITRNTDFAGANGIAIDATELVTGGHSGMTNPYMPEALTTTGVEWLASDNSVSSTQGVIGPAHTVPRYPSNVYYDTGSRAELVNEFNTRYPALATTEAAFAGLEAARVLPHLLMNDPRPHFFHQSNLAEQGTFYWVFDAVLARYNSYLNLAAPLVNLSLREAGEALHRAADWDLAIGAATAYYQQGRLYLSSSTSTVPVTGLPVTSFCAESGSPNLYGGECSAWIAPQSVDLGRQVWPTNRNPVFNQDITDQSNPEGTTITPLSAAATDPDAGDALTYSAIGLPAGLAIDPLTGVISGTVAAGAAVSQPPGGYLVTVTVRDWVGVDVTDTFKWFVPDVTPPEVSYVVTPSVPDGENGWYRSNVTLTWTVTEPQSPASLATTGCEKQSITVDQLETAYSCSATSAGGASPTVEVRIKRDATAPQVIDELPPAPATGLNGWYIGTVTEDFAASDATSGLADCLASFTRASVGEGAAVVVSSGACKDLAGNVNAGVNSPAYQIDMTAPSVVYSNPASLPNADGWYKADVTADFTATDTVSGFVGGATTKTGSAVSTGEGAAVTVGGPVFTDLAGNDSIAGTAISEPFKIDKTAPAISLRFRTPFSLGLWNNTEVQVEWQCFDTLSGVKSLTPPQTLGAEGASQSTAATCEDFAGNTAGDTQSNINIDKAAPTIEAALDKPPAATGWFNLATGAPSVGFTCADGGSGVKVCATPFTFGEGVGLSHSDTAFDWAGNSASAGVTDVKVDLTAPAFVSHGDVFADKSGDSDPVVVFDLPIVSDANAVSPVSCLPASGSAFPLARTTVTCTATDTAGNTGQTTFQVVVGDPTPPEISYVVSPSSPDGANGWYKSDVTLTWTVTEPQSPASLATTGCDKQTVVTDQPATTYTCKASSGGGSSEQSVTIKRDATAPEVSDLGVAAGSPGLNGWHTSAVTEGFSAGDATSGLANCSAYFTKTSATEGTAVLISSGSCSDNAGNTNPGVNSPTYKIDTTAPVVATRSNIAVDAIDATTAAVTFTPPSATDTNPLAPAVSCSPSSGSLFPAGDTVVTCRATDAAGNEGHSHFTITVTAVAGPDPAVVAIDSEPLKIGRTDYMAVLFDDGTVETRRVSDGTLRSSVVFPEVAPVALAVLPDTRGAPDLAVLGLTSGGAIRVYVRDSVTGALVSRAVFGIEYSEDMDLEASGANLVVLGTRPSDGAVRVQTRTRAGTLVGTANFGTAYSGTDLELIGNYVAVLGTRASDGAVRVQVRYRGGSLSGTASFGKAYSGDDLEIISGRLAVLGTRASDGAVRVQVRYRGGSLSGTASFGTASSGDHLSVVAGRVAVLGTRRADGAIQVQVRTTAGTLKGTGIYGADFSADDLEVIGANLAVLGTRTSDGATRVEVRTTSGAAYRTVMYD